MTHKVYCYVDESGQDTRGDLFVVAVVIVDDDKDDLAQTLEVIERKSRKLQRKWHKITYDRKITYIQRVLDLPQLREKCHFAIYHQSRNYFDMTVETIVRACQTITFSEYRAIVLIDALPAKQTVSVGNRLRQSGVPVKKVRGVRQDENDPFIRLADALCGLVRAAYDEQPEMLTLYERAVRQGILKHLPG